MSYKNSKAHRLEVKTQANVDMQEPFPSLNMAALMRIVIRRDDVQAAGPKILPTTQASTGNTSRAASHSVLDSTKGKRPTHVLTRGAETLA